MARTRKSPVKTISETERAELVEEMGLIWQELGASRMEGRVIGYLMLTNEPFVSSAELCEALQASAGSISGTTRRLKELGFIRQVAVASERSSFFRAEDDVWGGFLADEDKLYRRRREFAEKTLNILGEGDEHPRIRFRNMQDYHEWMQKRNRELLAQWEERKSTRND